MKKWVVICCLALLCSGCVTTHSGGASQVDLDSKKGATKSSKIRIALGLRYLENSDFANAKRNLDQAIETAPFLAQAYYSLGYYYQTVQEPELAEEQFKIALRKNGSAGEAHNIYGTFLCSEKRFQEAEQQFMAAIEVPDYTKPGATYENAAICAEEAGNEAQAIKYYMKAVDYNPGLFNTVKKVVDLELAKGNYDSARSILKRHEQAASMTPQSLSLRVNIERAAGDYAKAKRFLEFLQSRFPDYDYSKNN